MSKSQQQTAAFVFGVVFVITMLALVLFVPSPTPTQFFVFRTVLALAAAGVAAIIPGFIELTIPNWLRAGGALAVFAVVWFYNPATLVVTKPDDGAIQPLQKPIQDVTPSRPPHASVSSPLHPVAVWIVSPLVAPADAAQTLGPKAAAVDTGEVAVLRVLLGGNPDRASRLYDVTISNSTMRQIMVTTLRARWKYQPGRQMADEHGFALVPVAQYVIDFPLGTGGDWQTLSQPMSPLVVLPPGSLEKPTLAAVRLQVGFHFAERSKSHASGWNFAYEISLQTLDGQTLNVVSDGHWRESEMSPGSV